MGEIMRPSKNNPYVCQYCGFKTTRYSSIIRHLENRHGGYDTDPRYIWQVNKDYLAELIVMAENR